MTRLAGSNTVEPPISDAEQAVIVGLRQKKNRSYRCRSEIRGAAHTGTAHAWFQRLGIPRHASIAISRSRRLAVDFDCVTRLTESSVFAVIGVPVRIRLLMVRRHQLRFGVEAAPAVGAAN